MTTIIFFLLTTEQWGGLVPRSRHLDSGYCERESHSLYPHTQGSEMGASSLVLPLTDKAFDFPLLCCTVLLLEKTSKCM